MQRGHLNPPADESQQESLVKFTKDELNRQKAQKLFVEAELVGLSFKRKLELYQAARKTLEKNKHYTEDDIRLLSLCAYKKASVSTDIIQCTRALNLSGNYLGVLPISLSVNDWRQMAIMANEWIKSNKYNLFASFPFIRFALNCFYQIPEDQLTEHDKSYIQTFENFFKQQLHGEVPAKYDWVNCDKSALIHIKKDESKDSKKESKSSKKESKDSKKGFGDKQPALFGSHSSKKKYPLHKVDSEVEVKIDKEEEHESISFLEVPERKKEASSEKEDARPRHVKR